ncbi:MAG: hypothetical protein ACRBFS_11260 [Aureispira sp.]
MAVLMVKDNWEPRLRSYSCFMLGGELLLLIRFIGLFWGYGMTARTFDCLVLFLLVGIGLFLVEYYKNRENSAAWWPWLEQSLLWYLLLHLDKLLAVVSEAPLLGSMTMVGAQLILFWIGTGGLLWRRWLICNRIERQVSILLYGSLGGMLSILELEVANSVFLELLLLCAIVLLVMAISKVQAAVLNSE